MKLSHKSLVGGLGFAVSAVVAASPFAWQQLSQGYQEGASQTTSSEQIPAPCQGEKCDKNTNTNKPAPTKAAEGKCGEGKCGANHPVDKNTKPEDPSANKKDAVKQNKDGKQ